MFRPFFSKSGAPSSDSRLLIAFVSADCVINKSSDALVKLPVSAATRKYIRCCQFRNIRSFHSKFVILSPSNPLLYQSINAIPIAILPFSPVFVKILLLYSPSGEGKAENFSHNNGILVICISRGTVLWFSYKVKRGKEPIPKIFLLKYPFIGMLILSLPDVVCYCLMFNNMNGSWNP